MQYTDYLHDDDDARIGMIADLKHRVDDAREELDRRVSEHPFAMLAAALAAGAVLALKPRTRAPDAERTIGGMLFAGIAALAIRGVKAYAWSRISSTFDSHARERTR